jgi:hypothetical protein
MAPNKKKNKKKAAATNGTSTPATASAAGDITATSATTASSSHDAGVSILAAPAASSPTPPVDLTSLNLSGRMDQLTIQVDSQNHQNVAAAVVAAVTPQLQRRQHAFWDTQVRAVL